MRDGLTWKWAGGGTLDRRDIAMNAHYPNIWGHLRAHRHMLRNVAFLCTIWDFWLNHYIKILSNRMCAEHRGSDYSVEKDILYILFHVFAKYPQRTRPTYAKYVVPCSDGNTHHWSSLIQSVFVIAPHCVWYLQHLKICWHFEYKLILIDWCYRTY